MIYFIHRFFRLSGITSRFFFWVILLVFLTSLLYILSYSAIDKSKRVEEAEENLNYTLINQKLTLENWAEDHMEDARLFASFPASRQTQLEVMAQRFLYYHQFYSQLNAIVYIDENGIVQIDTAADEPIIRNSTIDLSDREYFSAAKAGEETIHLVVGKKPTGDQAIIFSSPVFTDANEFNGLVFSAVQLVEINEMLRQSIRGDTGKITLIDESGLIISLLTKKGDVNNPTVTEVDPQIMQIIKNKNEGFFEYVNNDGNEIYGTYVPILDGRFFLLNEINKEEVLKAHNDMVKIMFFITLGVFILAFIVLLPVSRGLLRPFFLLVSAIRRMKEGKYHTQLDERKFKTSPIELQQLMHGFNEMAASIKTNKELLQRMSQTDGLTGIANRRLFEERFEKEWINAQAMRKPISLIFIDIDHFKNYNDTFGHQQGDVCLKSIAVAVDHIATKENALAARYGGEEFVIILPNATEKDAHALAGEIQATIKNLQIKRAEGELDLFVTVSIGITTKIPQPAMNKEIMLREADQALYDAKSQGRNRIVVAKQL